MTLRGSTDTQRGDADFVISGLGLANPNTGQGVYARRLIAGLVKELGSRVVVVAPEWVQRPDEIPAENFRILPRFRVPRQSSFRQIVVSERLLRFVRREFPGAVFHSPGPILGLVKPKTTVVTLHDCLYRHFSNYDGRLKNRRLLLQATERFAARATLVLTDSEFSRRDLISNADIPRTKISVLYPWVGNEFLQPIDPEAVASLRVRYGLPDRFWLYLGGYDYRKNVEFLLRAYAAGAGNGKFPPLVLAGNIPSEKNRAHCDVSGALQRTKVPVFLPGAIPATDLPVLYRAASLLIFPSLMEGFGLPPAEALAVGTPVLSANNSSLPEVVRKQECLFDATELESLVVKLTAAAADERQFRAELPPEFGEAQAISCYLQLIEQIAGT
ncbi:MAG: glycosyltransferase family 1 protein [Chthoniobacterales bacterium]